MAAITIALRTAADDSMIHPRRVSPGPTRGCWRSRRASSGEDLPNAHGATILKTVANSGRKALTAPMLTQTTASTRHAHRVSELILGCPAGVSNPDSQASMG